MHHAKCSAVKPSEGKKSIQILKYTGLGLQMLGFIAAGTWIGSYLNERWNTTLAAPICILIFVLLAIGYVAKKLS